MTTRVLLVDDSEDMRLLCRLVLESDPLIEVCGEAANGAEAIECAGIDRPDVIVLDVEMPVMDGFTALPQLRERHPDIPVIMITAGLTSQRRAESLRLGASALIGKDPGMVGLRDALQEIKPRTAVAS